ncbi:hypothetical protein LAZ67_5003909 [Cordylochernes scorpioides]|uniref:Mariner Mos1 transposase n=1 Tax=Cordylochernes scorpioides TaxID=51811 RepID=A0ABY6KIR6_9ARAC|nr:hypothetical protein LAZ67_5003909 [Cordylochernes scorpioides]
MADINPEEDIHTYKAPQLAGIDSLIHIWILPIIYIIYILLYNATVAKNTIKDLGRGLLPHSPYSPDLAPSDYHLFTSLGHVLKNQEFSNSDILRKWLVEWFDSKGLEFFRQGIRKLPEGGPNV